MSHSIVPRTLSLLALAVSAGALGACASGVQAPNQRLADAQSTSRGAVEVGAESNPEAQLHLRLADEAIDRAKHAMADGDNQAAEYQLVRAQADADLALALAREQGARAEAQRAQQKANSLRATIQGAQQ